MRLKPFRWSTKTIILLAVFLVSMGLLPKYILEYVYQDQIHEIEGAPSGRVAIVFGAGLYRNGRPSPVLVDRVTAAVRLYQDGKVDALLMTGATRSPNYNEPAAMRQLALDMGVPAEAILVDEQGVRTFESCRRARESFGIQQALLVSQRYHLPRALVLCQAMGMQVEAVSSDLRFYRGYPFWEIREIPATLRALWDILSNSSDVGQPAEMPLPAAPRE
jgi:SanA protein